MNLLDPTQAVDLKYLGVRLPIPPPGASIEPVSSELSQSKGLYPHQDLIWVYIQTTEPELCIST